MSFSFVSEGKEVQTSYETGFAILKVAELRGWKHPGNRRDGALGSLVTVEEKSARSFNRSLKRGLDDIPQEDLTTRYWEARIQSILLEGIGLRKRQAKLLQAWVGQNLPPGPRAFAELAKILGKAPFWIMDQQPSPWILLSGLDGIAEVKAIISLTRKGAFRYG